MTKDSSFASSLLASVLIHLAAFISVSALMGHQSHLSTRNLIPISLLEPSQETNTTPERDKDKFLERNSSQQRQNRNTHKTQRCKSKANKLKSSLRLWRNPKKNRRNRVKTKCRRRHRSNESFPSAPMTKAAAPPWGRALFPPKPIAASCRAQEAQAEVAPPSPDSAAVTAPRVCRRPPARFERIAKRSRFKPSAPPIHRWRCAPDSKAM